MGVLNWDLNCEKPVMIRTGELVLQPKKKIVQIKVRTLSGKSIDMF